MPVYSCNAVAKVIGGFAAVVTRTGEQIAEHQSPDFSFDPA